MFLLKDFNEEQAQKVYKEKTVFAVWYLEKETKKAFLIDWFSNEYYNTNDFIDFWNMLKEIYFYNKEEKSEVLGDYLHTSEELEKIGKNYILVEV